MGMMSSPALRKTVPLDGFAHELSVTPTSKRS